MRQFATAIWPACFGVLVTICMFLTHEVSATDCKGPSSSSSSSSIDELQEQERIEARKEANIKGIESFHTGDLDSAIKYFKEALQHDPGNSVTQLNLKIAEAEKERQEEVRRISEQRPKKTDDQPVDSGSFTSPSIGHLLDTGKSKPAQPEGDEEDEEDVSKEIKKQEDLKFIKRSKPKKPEDALPFPLLKEEKRKATTPSRKDSKDYLGTMSKKPALRKIPYSGDKEGLLSYPLPYPLPYILKGQKK